MKLLRDPLTDPKSVRPHWIDQFKSVDESVMRKMIAKDVNNAHRTCFIDGKTFKISVEKKDLFYTSEPKAAPAP